MGRKYKIGNRVFEVGKSYYEATYSEADEEEGEKEHVSIDEYVLRCVRRSFCRAGFSKFELGTYAHFTLKLKGLTWVKRSTKHHDWGFDKNCPSWCKRPVRVGEKNTCDLSPTIVGAIRVELASIRKYEQYSNSTYAMRRATKKYKEQAIRKLTQKLNRVKKHGKTT